MGLIIFAAYIPSIPLRRVAEAYARKTGIAIDVRAGRPESWLPKLRDGEPGDLMSCGAEFLLDMAEAEGILEPTSRRSLGVRRAALVVPRANPARIRTLADLAQPGVRVGIAAGGCTLGLWDEVATRADLAAPVRANITARANGCGALIGLLERASVDVAFGWHNFDRVSDTAVIQLPQELQVWRSTGIGIIRETPHREEAEQFLEWLTSVEGRAPYRELGWLIEPNPTSARTAA